MIAAKYEDKKPSIDHLDVDSSETLANIFQFRRYRDEVNRRGDVNGKANGNYGKLNASPTAAMVSNKHDNDCNEKKGTPLICDHEDNI